MNKFHSIALGGTFALGLIGAAHAADTAPVTGAWKLTVGAADAPCTLTLADGGDVTSGGDCTNGGSQIGRWKTVGQSLQLLANNGTMIAWLNAKGDTYTGKNVADSRLVVLAR